MDKKIFTALLVVSLAVVIAIVISKKEQQPVYQAILEQQNDILEGQARMEQKMGVAGSQGTSGDLIRALSRIDALEQRLASVENELKTVKAAPQAAAPMPPQEDYTKVYDIPVDHTPVIGKKDAPVTIVEFIDFQCPFCSRFHQPMLEVSKAFPNDVNYMMKNFPLSFHPQAMPAAKAALAANEQGKYKEMADKLFENFQNLSPETFDKVAEEIGLNMKTFKKDLEENNAKYEKMIQDDIALGGQVGVRGTPTFYINGRKTMARDLPSFKREIEEILKNKK